MLTHVEGERERERVREEREHEHEPQLLVVTHSPDGLL